MSNALKDVVAGSAGGVLICLTGHPFDTVKVRMQTSTKYSGMVNAFSTIVKEEGFFGIYKGVQSPLVGTTFMNAYLFCVNGVIKKITQGNNPNKELTLSQILQSGALAGAALSFVESPVDFFKCQLQVRYKSYNGYVDCVSKILRTYGIRGAYQGLGATLVRNVPANCAYFGAYEFVKRKLSKGKKHPAVLDILFAGFIGGTANWIVSYPADVVKSTMQTDTPNKAERIFKTISITSREIYKRFGIKGFFKGLTPALVRAGPANAFGFLGYEVTRRFIDGE